MAYNDPELDKIMKGKSRFDGKRRGAFTRLLRYTLRYRLILLIANVALVITSLGLVALPYLAG